MDYLADIFLSNPYLKTFLYVFFHIPSHSFIGFVSSVMSILAMLSYGIYKIKRPELAKDQRGKFVLTAFVGTLIIISIYSVQSQSGNSFVLFLYLSIAFYAYYWAVLMLPENRKKYLIAPCGVFLITVCIWGGNIQYAHYKNFVYPAILCADKETKADLDLTVPSGPPPSSAVATLLGVPRGSGCWKK